MTKQDQMLETISKAVMDSWGDNLDQNVSLALNAMAMCAGLAAGAIEMRRPGQRVSAAELLAAVLESEIVSKGMAAPRGVQ